MKVYNYSIVFQEFPNEMTLALNISNCPCHCVGCHSPFLAEDKGEELTFDYLDTLISKNNGVTCIGIMGGDADPETVMDIAAHITKKYNGKYKIGWYSGCDQLPENFDGSLFDFVKIGHYDNALGGLDSINTNQRMYFVKRQVYGNYIIVEGVQNITSWFNMKSTKYLLNSPFEPGNW